MKNLSETFAYLEKFLNVVEELDPSAERCSVVCRDVEGVPSCYRLLHQE
jgi:hypothetical protein